jgi:hypothetical protein
VPGRCFEDERLLRADLERLAFRCSLRIVEQGQQIVAREPGERGEVLALQRPLEEDPDRITLGVLDLEGDRDPAPPVRVVDELGVVEEHARRLVVVDPERLGLQDRDAGAEAVVGREPAGDASRSAKANPGAGSPSGVLAGRARAQLPPGGRGTRPRSSRDRPRCPTRGTRSGRGRSIRLGPGR